MKIDVIKKIDYKGCPIYVRRIGTIFEYLFVYKNEIYQNYNLITPKWYKMFKENPFTEKETHDLVMICIGQAKHSIKKLKNINSNEVNGKNN